MDGGQDQVVVFLQRHARLGAGDIGRVECDLGQEGLTRRIGDDDLLKLQQVGATRVSILMDALQMRIIPDRTRRSASGQPPATLVATLKTQSPSAYAQVAQTPTENDRPLNPTLARRTPLPRRNLYPPLGVSLANRQDFHLNRTPAQYPDIRQTLEHRRIYCQAVRCSNRMTLPKPISAIPPTASISLPKRRPRNRPARIPVELITIVVNPMQSATTKMFT